MVVLLVSLAVLATGPVISAHAADLAQDIQQMKKQAGQLMKEQPELMQKFRENPHAVIAAAYRKNVMSYAAALHELAEKNELPPGAGKELVGEMKKNLEAMKKHYDEAWDSSPELKAKLGELQKATEAAYGKLQEHVNALEKAVQAEKADMQTILKETTEIFPRCEGMGVMERLKEGGKKLLK